MAKIKRTKEEPIEVASKPTPEQIEKSKVELRKLAEQSNDPILSRLAQCYEHALRWVTEKTAGWQRPEDDAKTMVEIIKQDLERESNK